MDNILSKMPYEFLSILEAHYSSHNFFLEEDHILKNTKILRIFQLRSFMEKKILYVPRTLPQSCIQNLKIANCSW